MSSVAQHRRERLGIRGSGAMPIEVMASPLPIGGPTLLTSVGSLVGYLGVRQHAVVHGLVVTVQSIVAASIAGSLSTNTNATHRVGGETYSIDDNGIPRKSGANSNATR